VGLSVLTGALRYRQWNAQHGEGDNRKEPPSEPSSIVIPFLTIVPQLSLFYPWVFVVATLVEQNLFTLATTAATIFYGGKYLERAWGSPEFAKFLLVISVVPNVLAFATYILWFAFTGNVVRSYGAPNAGPEQ
jgi:membrane associated rhomboid family serine protease